jgi:hypothetical protein
MLPSALSPFSVWYREFDVYTGYLWMRLACHQYCKLAPTPAFLPPFYPIVFGAFQVNKPHPAFNRASAAGFMASPPPSSAAVFHQPSFHRRHHRLRWFTRGSETATT